MPDLNEVHLWYLSPHEVNAKALISKYYSIVNDVELKKINRYLFEKDRHTCLLTRALIRFVLSCYSDKNPSLWRFSQNDYGKPQIINSSLISCKFNISHTSGLICLAITTDHEVGVDVETLDRKSIDMGIAKRFFSQVEFDVLKITPEKDQKNMFLKFWTLKEAYIKAKGMGLSIPLDSFYFTFSPEAERIKFHSHGYDESEYWQFFNSSVDNKFILSLAIETPSYPRLDVKVFRCVPFKYVTEGSIILT